MLDMGYFQVVALVLYYELCLSSNRLDNMRNYRINSAGLISHWSFRRKMKEIEGEEIIKEIRQKIF